jgi:hypothetical protein
VHDYFEVLGLPSNAPASEVRRAHARRTSRAHPDFRGLTGLETAPAAPSALAGVLDADVAVDFADLSGFVDRMQGAFFSAGLPFRPDPS